MARPPITDRDKKVSLSVSVTLDTENQIIAWKDTLPKARPGLIIDRLVTHGKATAFNPANEKGPVATTPSGPQSLTHTSSRPKAKAKTR